MSKIKKVTNVTESKIEVLPTIEVKQIEFINATMAYTLYLTSNVFNRKVRRSHVIIIEQSFKQFGTSGATIIIVKTKAISGKIEYYVADGQHRAIAAANLGMPLNVASVELVDDTKLNLVKYVAALNSKSKQWTTDIYLEKYAECGQLNYSYFAEIKKTTGLTVSDLCNIFTGSGSSQALKEFKEGNINVADVKDSEQMLAAVMLVKQHLPNKSFARRSLYATLRLVNKEVGYMKMAKAIVKAKKTDFEFSENEGGAIYTA